MENKKQTVYAVVAPTYEYDDERYVESETCSPEALYIKREDAENAVRECVVRDMRNRLSFHRAAYLFSEDGVPVESVLKIEEIIGKVVRTSKRESSKTERVYVNGFESSFDPSLLSDNQAERLAEAIEYAPYVIREMDLN